MLPDGSVRAEQNLGRKRGRKPEEGIFKKDFGEENGTRKRAGSNRPYQDISITPLGVSRQSNFRRNTSRIFRMVNLVAGMTPPQ
jgi:hypothetical protein